MSKGSRHNGFRDTEVDRLVGEILHVFAINPSQNTHLRRRLEDLRWVLRADYEEVVDRFTREGALPLAELERRAQTIVPEFNRIPLRFGDTIESIDDLSQSLGARVRLSRYGRQGNPLRGFYHHDVGGRPLIWLNLNHTPTAMAATLGHEVGHLLWEDIQADREATPRPFYNFDYGEHLEDPREFFADAVATMAAYPRDAAHRLFRGKGWPAKLRSLRTRERHTVAEVYGYLQENYGAELEMASGLSVLRRLSYITSMVHFAKVRAAIIRKVGL